ncbi:hypothetical protein D3C79_742090 [compost metagenome]
MVRPVDLQRAWAGTRQALLVDPGMQVIGHCFGYCNNAIHARQRFQPLREAMLGVGREDLRNAQRQQVMQHEPYADANITVMLDKPGFAGLHQGIATQVKADQQVAGHGVNPFVRCPLIRQAEHGAGVTPCVVVSPAATAVAKVHGLNAVARGAVFQQGHHYCAGHPLDAGLQIGAARGGDVKEQPALWAGQWQVVSDTLRELAQFTLAER